MGDSDKPPGQPPPGGGSEYGATVNQIHVPDQRTATSTWVKGSVTGGRSFAKIIEDEQKERNILELQISRNSIEDELGNMNKVKPLNFEDLGEFLFDVLKINPDDCVSFNFSSGRYDQREVKFKPFVDTTPYLRLTPITFKDHEISVRKQRQNTVRVSFKNVPLNVPDEEILNICNSYGKPVSQVSYEKLNNIRGYKVTGSTRYVDVELEQGVCFENYYWLECPLPGDIGKRIVVLHSNQIPQCSHCLRKSGQGCPAMGNGKACEKSGTKRAKMGDYMENLKKRVGYTSLKIKHAERQALLFPSLIGVPGEKSSEQEVRNLWNMEEGELEEEMVMLTPIEERDRLIKKQQDEIEALKMEQTSSSPLQMSLEVVKAENENLKKSIKTYEKKLMFTRNVTEQKLLENISDPNFFRDDPHLVQVYTATLDEDEIVEKTFDTDDSSEDNTPRSRRDQFLLASVAKHLDTSDPSLHAVQVERLDHIKEQVMERVKLTHLNKSKPRTATPKRRLSLSLFDNDRSSPRPRTKSPPLPTKPPNES